MDHAPRLFRLVVHGGDTIDGHWELRRDDSTWKDDLQITYRRQR
ncbi:MAG: hypothetical protein ACRDVL_06480 [Acidimicrobiia bacterium]